MGLPKERRYQIWTASVIVALIGFIQFNCNESMPRAQVWAMEANRPWMMLDPSMFQQWPIPYADKSNPQIMYLVFFGKKGDALKIDLKDKSIAACKFQTDQGDPGKTIEYSEVLSRASKDGAYRILDRVHRDIEHLPLWDEFRGRIENRRVSHKFGYPLATEPGTRVAELHTGYWYVMEKRGDRKVELLRVRVKDAELFGGDELGHLYISQDKHWVVFTLANLPARTFIFDREALTPEVFQ